MNILFILLLNGLLLQQIIAAPGALTIPGVGTVTVSGRPGGLIVPPPHMGHSHSHTTFDPRHLENINKLTLDSSIKPVGGLPTSSMNILPPSSMNIPPIAPVLAVAPPIAPVLAVDPPIAPEERTYVPPVHLQRIDSSYAQKDKIVNHLNDIGRSVVNNLKDVHGTWKEYNFDINNRGGIRKKGDNFINIKYKGAQIAHLTIYDKPTDVSKHRLSSIHLGVIDGTITHHYYMVNAETQLNVIWRKQFSDTPELSDEVLTVANSISDYFIHEGLNVPK